MANKFNEVIFKRDSSGTWHFIAKDKIGLELNINIREVDDGWGYHIIYDGTDEDDPRNTEEIINDKTINLAGFDLMSGG